MRTVQSDQYRKEEKPTAVAPVSSDRTNNVNLIRLLATLFVFAGHQGIIYGVAAPTFAGYNLHTIGVYTLFLMAGYLITTSWLSDPHPLRYALKRFFRLWPPFALMVLIMTFVTGPLLSEMGTEGYFSSWFSAYLKNLRFFPVFAQPGVFTSVPLPNSTNGSLWTMPIEAALYVVTPFILTLFRVKTRNKASFILTAGLTLLLFLGELYLWTLPEMPRIVFYGTDWVSAYHLIVMYMLGVLFTYDEVKQLLNVQAGCLAICLLLFVQPAIVWIKHAVFMLSLAYFVFSFAFARHPAFSGYGRNVEPAYGIYLYGFFFQQLTIYIKVSHGYTWGYMTCFLIGFLPTLAAAYLSCVLVENPLLKLCRHLNKKIR